MKNQNLNFKISFLSLLLFINFAFTACEENKESLDENKKDNKISVKHLSAENIPNIISVLKPNYSSKSSSSMSNIISAPFGSIVIEDVLEVIDSLGNKNYSFTLIPIKQNLILFLILL